MIKVSGNAVLTSFAVFVLTWLLLLAAPKHWWELNLIVASVTAGATAMFFLGSANVKHHRLAQDTGWTPTALDLQNTQLPPAVFSRVQYRLWDSERVMLASRRHKVMLIPVGLIAVAGALALWAGVYFWIWPLLRANNALTSQTKLSPRLDFDISTAVNWVLVTLCFLISIMFLYVALMLWQDWKWSVRIITDQRYIDLREQSDYIFWLGRRFDITPVNQIKDVDDRAGMWGSVFGWGTVEYKRFPNPTADETQTVVLKLVPDEGAFAEALRLVSPAVAPRRQKAH